MESKRLYRCYAGNLRTVRYEEAELEAMIPLREYALLYSYSEGSVRVLIKKGKVLGKKYKSRWFVLPIPPGKVRITTF